MPELHQPAEVSPSLLHRADDSIDVVTAFRESMSHHASTVVMVTCEVDGRPWGLTISSCCSVSASPPMILISLGTHTVSANAIREQGRFGISIMGQGGRDAARLGAAAGKPKFVEQFCHSRAECSDERTTPIVRGAVAHLDCHAVQQTEVLDHTIFFGQVTDVIRFKGQRPLIYYARSYTRLDNEEPWWC